MSSESDNKNKPERSRSRSKQRRRDNNDGKSDFTPDKERDRERDRDRRIKIKIPEQTNYLLSYHQFANMQSERMSNENLQKGYEKYKKEWEQKQNEEFLKEYKKDAWFAEKYDPEVLDLLERDRKQNNRRLYTEFLARLEDGYYDKIDLRVKQPSELGVVEQFDEQQQQSSNLSYIMNQTYDVHLNNNFDITRSPFFGLDQDVNTLFIKSVPRPISRYDIRGVVEKVEGYKYLTMSDPVKRNNLTRFCWIQFDNEENCNKAALSLSGLMIKNQSLMISKSTTKVKRVKILKNYPSTRIQTDVDTLLRLIIKLDEQVGIQENRLIQRQFNSIQSKFDTFLLYLRKVHAYDYYTSTMYQNERILSLKVGSAFLRIEADYQELENVQTVFKKIQEKSEERITKGSEIPDYMGFLRQQIEKFVKQTEKTDIKEIWKCMFCDKKFKTCEFLSKHMISKHEEIKFKKIQVIMEQLYLKDPFKITFSSLKDRDQKNRRFYGEGTYRNRRREYKDLDEPEAEKTAKPQYGGKPMVNFLDI